MGEIPTRKPLTALVSPELLPAIVDTTGALVVVLDRDGRIVLFNRACERLTGYSFEEVEGTYVWDRLLVAEEIDSVKEVFANLRAGKFPNEHENYWLIKSGRRRWIHWNNTALVGDDGLVGYVIGTGIDITERREAEEATRQLAAMVESAEDAIFSVALDGTILTWNRGAARMYDYTPQEVIGRPISLIFPEGFDDTVGVVERVKRGERVERFEVPRVRKDGRTIYVSLTISPIRNAAGEVVATARTARDVTADREMQAALEEAHQRNAALLDTAVDGIITIDERGRIQSINKAVERIFGYLESEIIGKNVTVLMPSPYREQHDDYLRRYLETGEKRIIGIGREVSGRRKDGTVLPVDLAVGEIHVRGRRLFTGILRDITSRKQLELEAQRRLQELAHVSRSQSISEVASGLAHEINQPLTAIVSYAEACRLMLQSSTVNAELVRDSLADIIKQGERASGIINRLREFVRRGEMEHSTVDVNALVRGALELLRHELALHDVQVQLALEERLPPVRASRVQIEQVLFNLVRNAIDAMQTSHTRALEIKTGVMRGERPMLAVGVIDTGEGLPPSSSERLFDAFFSTKPEGMGLGLSISRSIVEAHGGRIWASPRNGGGTSFYFTLPLAEAGER